MIEVDSRFRGSDELKKIITECDLPSLAVNLSQTVLRSGNSVFYAVNACMDGYFLQLAGSDKSNLLEAVLLLQVA